MIRVLSITVYKANSSEKIHYENYRDNQFTKHDHIRDWINYQENKWSDIKGHPCKVYPVIRTKPIKKIDMMEVLAHTAHIMGQPLDEVISKSRQRKYVEVRQVACMILFDMDYMPMDIEKELPFKNRAVYDYRIKVEDRIAVEKGFEDRYEKIKKTVRGLTNGSGTKLK